MRFTLEEVAYRVLPRVAPGRALSDWEWGILRALAETLREGTPVEIGADTIADNVETFLIEGRSQRTWRIRALLALIEAMTLAHQRQSFVSLSTEARRKLVETQFMSGRHLWRLCAKVRYLVTLGIYGDRAAVAATGYVPIEERDRFREAPKSGAGLAKLRAHAQGEVLHA